MYDRELVVSILKNIAWSLDQITKRFKAIQSSDDFLKDDIELLNKKNFVAFDN